MILWMVRTRAQRTMDRLQLENLTIEQLREEAVKCQITVSWNRDQLVNEIMDHLERNGPLIDMLRSVPTENETEQQCVVNSPVEGQSSSPVTAAAFEQILATVNTCTQQQQLIMQQLSLLSQRIDGSNSGATSGRVESSPSNPVSAMTNPSILSNVMMNNMIRQPMINSLPPANAVQLLAPQLPEFGGTEEENIRLWVQRVDRVAQIHRAPDDVVLLAASSKLIKAAKQWYNLQYGIVLEIWVNLRQELIKMFDRRAPFYTAMQKIEARKWNHMKELFGQYAIDKLALMHHLNLSKTDEINLLIGGIMKSALRATALTMSMQPLYQFLEGMRRITEGVLELERKSPVANRSQKFTEVCRNCGKKGHLAKTCRE